MMRETREALVFVSSCGVIDACQLLRQRMFKVHGLRSPYHILILSPIPKLQLSIISNIIIISISLVQIFSNIQITVLEWHTALWPRHSSFRWKEGLSGFNINCFLSKLNKNVWVNWTWRVMQPKLPHSISTQVILLLQISRGKYKVPHRNFTQVLLLFTDFARQV